MSAQLPAKNYRLCAVFAKSWLYFWHCCYFGCKNKCFDHDPNYISLATAFVIHHATLFISLSLFFLVI